ncbi:zf-HC2 domain-containing protein [Halomonas elongata]|uniref:zf-HC2 domain-containing protein n=1 Tax=Halomonas elongata TaxID=2746 RepID=UPI0023AE7D3F|nr:zf-HC2 domain-containing protein [Halomonas elongata]
MCREATRLMSLKQDRRLTLSERLSLRIHLMMCDPCRQCHHQFALMHQLGERFEAALERPPETTRGSERDSHD